MERPNLFSRRRHEIVLDVVAPHLLIRANQIQKLGFVPRRRKGKKELVRAGLRIADECQSACVRQLCVAKQIADDVCGKHSAFGVIAGQEFHRAEPVIVVLPVRFIVVLSVHTFSLVESPFS
jgi:hypothetical protein